MAHTNEVIENQNFLDVGKRATEVADEVGINEGLDALEGSEIERRKLTSDEAKPYLYHELIKTVNDFGNGNRIVINIQLLPTQQEDYNSKIHHLRAIISFEGELIRIKPDDTSEIYDPEDNYNFTLSKDGNLNGVLPKNFDLDNFFSASELRNGIEEVEYHGKMVSHEYKNDFRNPYWVSSGIDDYKP